MTAMKDVASERKRQIEVEKYTTDADDTYVDGQLARAAVCYATTAIVTASLLRRGLDPALIEEKSKIAGVPASWPWDHAWWKPKGARRDLVRAAALMIAEIERLDRAAAATAPQQTDPSDRVKHVLAKHLCVTTAEVPDDLSSLDLDSLDQVEIGIALEDEFDIQEISDDDMTNVRSVGEWTDLIVRKLAAKAAA